MAGLKGKSGPPGNMNAFKHGLAAIQKRREESVTTEVRGADYWRNNTCFSNAMRPGFIALSDSVVSDTSPVPRKSSAQTLPA